MFDRFANILGVNGKQPLASLRKRAAKINLPVLITFDNFETPWEPTENRERLESFLAELLLIPQVSVIVTLRGAERPSGVAWTKPFLPPLQPLDLQSSIQIFTSISDTPDDDPDMHQLITAVDMVPLAVTLIANQAQYISCQDLINRWNTQKTRMVSRGYDGRLSSLDISIQVSLSRAGSNKNLVLDVSFNYYLYFPMGLRTRCSSI